MILAALGKICIAQAFTAGTTISENVIQIATIDYSQFTDLWLVIDTNVIASGSGTLTFDLVIDTAVALDGTRRSVVRTYLAAISDLRCATAGRYITNLNIGKTLKEMLDTDASDYAYIGLEVVLSSSAAITINAALSPSEPQSETHRQVTVSGVGIPSISSDGAGFVV